MKKEELEERARGYARRKGYAYGVNDEGKPS